MKAMMCVIRVPEREKIVKTIFRGRMAENLVELS